MAESITRRTLSRLITGGALAIATATRFRVTTAMQTNGIVSGGIGLTRTEFERFFGHGEATQTYARYIDPTYGGPIYVGYDFISHQDGLLTFLELQWSDVSQAGGLAPNDASYEVSTVIPADALLQRQFWMGATPGGPISLRSEEWTSASLGAVRGGRGAILVVYQEQMGSLDPGSGMDVIVSAATIAVEE